MLSSIFTPPQPVNDWLGVIAVILASELNLITFVALLAIVPDNNKSQDGVAEPLL